MLGTLITTALCVGSSLSVKADLIGLYQFNDSTNLGKDTSGKNNDAINFGATYTASGYQDGAAFFGGTGYLRSYINVSTSALPQLTWGAWVRPILINPVRAILSGDNGGFDRNMNIDSRGGSLAWSTFKGTGVFGSGITPSTTGFTFLATVYDQSSNGLTFYVDGQSFTTTTNFGVSNNFFDIGHNPGYGEFFNGTIDNVFVYNQALSASQIASIRANGFPNSVPEPGSIALLVGLSLSGAAFLHRRKNANKAI